MINASEPLTRAIEAINNFIGPGADESQQLIAAKCRALLSGYDARWRNAGYIALSVEQTYTAPLVNPDTQRTSRTFTIAGKLDVVAELDGRTLIIDHKTTSQDIEDPNSTYWRQLVIEGQVTHYMLLQWLNGAKCDSAMWDVCKKPSISPKKLTKAERASAVAERKYFGRLLNEDCLASLQTSERETIPMYEARLAYDCTVERPDRYFARRSIPRLDKDIYQYAAELWEHGQDLLRTRNRSQDGNLPPRNSGACFTYSTPCQFLGLCSGFDRPDSDRWKRKSQVHSELPIIEGDDKEVLTNSRIRCFQTCRRKEHYQYQLGLERNDAEDSESLWFGTLYHVGLESWWRCFLRPSPEPQTESADCCSVPLS